MYLLKVITKSYYNIFTENLPINQSNQACNILNNKSPRKWALYHSLGHYAKYNFRPFLKVFHKSCILTILKYADSPKQIFISHIYYKKARESVLIAR